MGNFKKAQEIIKEYNKLRLNPKAKNSFGLNKKLRSAGYTEQEYLDEIQKRYLVNANIKFKEITDETLVEEIQKSLDKNTILFVNPRNVCVYNGDKDFNSNYSKEHNIPVHQLGYSGGTLVALNGDLGCVFILKKDGLLGYLQSKVKNWVSENIRECEINGNDILVNGKKVIGFASTKIGDNYIYYFQSSFSVNLNLIQEISVKKMVKIPAGLSEFSNKTRVDLINEIKLWLQ